MDTVMELELHNFQRWEHKSWTFHPGTTNIKGNSGSGKSTICRAIHFVLYGGKRFRNTGTKGQDKTQRTWVRLTMKSANVNYSLLRERPSETITLTLNGRELKGNEAQAWIQSEYGTEDAWTASSYLAQGLRHFFLQESNADKKDLLRQITFGSMGEQDSPEFFTEPIVEYVQTIKLDMERKRSEITIRTGIIDDLVKKNPTVNKYGYVTENTVQKLKTELSKLEKDRARASVFLERSSELTGLERRVREIHEGAILDADGLRSEFAKLRLYSDYNTRLSTFDPRVVDVSPDDVRESARLYAEYTRAGWTESTDLSVFLKEQNRLHDEYAAYKRLESENSVFESQNRAIREQNRIVNEEYSKHVREYNRFLELNSLLEDFDERALTVHAEALIRDRTLYNTYVKHGYDVRTNVQDFLRGQIELSEVRRTNLENRKKNADMDYRNSIKSREYSTSLSLFETELLNYERNTMESEDLQSELNRVLSTSFYDFGDEDDGTIEFMETGLQDIRLQLCRLECPNCKSPLEYRDGMLYLTDDVNVDELRLTIELGEQELKRRKRLEAYRVREHAFVPFTRTILVRPQRPVLEGLLPIVNVKESNLDTFTVPEYDYDTLVSLMSSMGRIPEYRERERITIETEPPRPIELPLNELHRIRMTAKPRLSVFDVPEFEYGECLRLESSLNQIPVFSEFLKSDYGSMGLNNTELLKRMAELGTVISQVDADAAELKTIERRIQEIRSLGDWTPLALEKLNGRIQVMDDRIRVSQVSMIHQDHKDVLEKLELEYSDMAAALQDATDVIEFIQGIANTSITDMIVSINSALTYVCDELFEVPIMVALSTTKELKNGQERSIVNLEIVYNGNAYSDPSELSGGERSRISFALLIALASVNPSPICILDEVLSSIESELKRRALEVLSTIGSGKYVLHICHDVCEGYHDHTIDVE
jgi:DNA repair exonuclease SbcCD ATPase subunit